MSGTVYALLVGINDYGGNPSSLRGCRADVEALSMVLHGRVPPGSLQLETLLDQDNPRQGVIDVFRSHLGQAGPGDVALFAFSGHGSYEPVEERFWFLEPTGQNQTIVCADSRNKRAGDLADKELNELIADVAEKGPHVVVVLDCCHSGGGTATLRVFPPTSVFDWPRRPTRRGPSSATSPPSARLPKPPPRVSEWATSATPGTWRCRRANPISSRRRCLSATALEARSPPPSNTP